MQDERKTHGFSIQCWEEEVILIMAYVSLTNIGVSPSGMCVKRAIGNLRMRILKFPIARF